MHLADDDTDGGPITKAKGMQISFIKRNSSDVASVLFVSFIVRHFFLRLVKSSIVRNVEYMMWVECSLLTQVYMINAWCADDVVMS